MNEIKVIKEQEVLGKQFKIYGDFENPLFLAKDICNWIEHNNITHLTNMVDEDEKLTYTIRNSGQNREMWFVTEDGLYEILMQSKKPIAKEFKKQVKTILKSIRKDGGYIANQENLDEDELIANALIVAQNIINRQKQKLIEQKPLVEFAEAVSQSVNAISVGDFAQLLADDNIAIGQNRLFKWLREHKYLKPGNYPMQTYLDRGYFDVIEQTYLTPQGINTSCKTLITGKGQLYFREKINADPTVKKG